MLGNRLESENHFMVPNLITKMQKYHLFNPQLCGHAWQINFELTGGNWQKWKRVFLTCHCHKIYRDEAVGLKSCKNTWKITIFVKMWNLGQYRENLIFVNNCLLKAWISKILLHMCDTYSYDYQKHSTFRFNFINFQLYIDFPFQFCVFYRKIT